MNRQNIVKVFGKSFPTAWNNATKFGVNPVKSAVQNGLFNRVNQILMAITLSSISGKSRICRIATFSGAGLVKALLKLDKAINENAISATLKNLGQSGAQAANVVALKKHIKSVFRADSGFFSGGSSYLLKSFCWDYLFKVRLKNLQQLLQSQIYSKLRFA
ncbi:MAG: hypothetical protein M1292_10645 [Bacteroidetes bacterium]|nr:hypothetical protein [Bacteroidota bacterium]